MLVRIETKDSVRKRMLTLMQKQKKEDRLKKSRLIADKLFALGEFTGVHLVLFYASFDGEVDTFEMMKQAQRIGKTIALPIIIKEEKRLTPSRIENLDKELAVGPYGVKQPINDYWRPVELNHIELVIVPGIAFDKRNNRLGRGAGYYDLFLKTLSKDTPSIGLAFDFQLLSSLPYQKGQDVPVTRVITN